MKNETAIPLRAGPLTLLFDDGMIRSVRYGDSEIVRRVYMALRDQDWNTIPFTVSKPVIEKDEDSFSLTFDARHIAPGIDFSWQGEITGCAAGTVGITMRGVAWCDFFRNRIGWCVLHPLAQCQDASCTVEHADGSRESARFPGNRIAPYPPFLAIKAMTYRAAAGVACTLRFDGDVFETEDQRNWTDASFKTYSTPHALPVPVMVAAGTSIEQSVTISLSGHVVALPAGSPKPVALDVDRSFGVATSIPRIGLRAQTPDTLTMRHMERLRHIGCSDVRFDIVPGVDDIRNIAAAAASLCAATGCAAEIALHLSSNTVRELDTIAREFAALPVPVCRWLVLRSDTTVTLPETFAAAWSILAGVVPSAAIAVGTNRYFVEVNKAAPLPEGFDALCFCATPQVHTFDDRAIIENIEGLCACIVSARLISGNKPVVVSPLTLRPRSDPSRPRKQGGVDERQQQLFGAAWLTGALAAAVTAKLDALTCFNAVTGPEGVMADDGEELWPLYHTLASGICGATAVAARLINIDGPAIAALRWEGTTGRQVLVANLTAGAITVPVTGITQECTIAVLDETTVGNAGSEMQFWDTCAQPVVVRHTEEYALSLGPYAVARLTCPG